MIFLVGSLIAVGLILLGWINLRRVQFRTQRPDPWPPPGPALRDGLRLLTDRHQRLWIGSAAVAAAAIAIIILLHTAGAAIAIWMMIIWLGIGTRRMFRIRAAWKRRFFAAASSALDYPIDALTGRWVFIHRWKNHYEPGVTILRCPEGVGPQTAGREDLLRYALNDDPILSARYDWGIQWAHQSNRPDQWQANCFPNDITDADDQDDAIPDLQTVIAGLLEVDAVDANNVDDSATTGAAGKIVDATQRTLRVLLPVLIPAVAALLIITNPATWAWTRTHSILPAAVVTVVIMAMIFNTVRRFVVERIRDVAYMPFGMHLRAWYGVIFFEDHWYLRIIWIAGGVVAAWAAFRQPTPLGDWNRLGPAAIAVGIWGLTTAIRYTMVALSRWATLTKMYSIAAQRLNYSRHFRRKRGARPQGPWKRIHIRWAGPTTPGPVQIAIPPQWESTKKDRTDSFRDEWNQKAFPSGRRSEGLLWDIRIDFDVQMIVAEPYVEENPTDVRVGRAVTPDWHTFKVGRATRSGRWVIASLKSAPHALVCGETGGGKSAHMETWAYQAALKRVWEIVIHDAGGSGGWARWDGRPGILPAVQDSEDDACEVALTYRQIAASWAEQRKEIDARKDLLQAYKVSSWTDLPPDVRPTPRLILCDEWLSLLTTAINKALPDPESQQRQADALQIWADWGFAILEGRKVGFHVVTGMQRPDAKVTDGAFRDNIGIRVICGVMYRDGMGMMFGNSYKPPIEFVCDDPEDIRRRNQSLAAGRLLAKPGSRNSVFVVQGPWFGDPGNAADLEQYLPRAGEQPVLGADPGRKTRRHHQKSTTRQPTDQLRDLGVTDDPPEPVHGTELEDDPLLIPEELLPDDSPVLSSWESPDPGEQMRILSMSRAPAQDRTPPNDRDDDSDDDLPPWLPDTAGSDIPPDPVRRRR